MKVLVIGRGAREHALCSQLAKECEVSCTPGNPGIAEEVDTYSVDESDFDSLRQLCRVQEFDLAVFGPEQPLIDGGADRLRELGIAVFGPNRSAARLEGSKKFSKEMMRVASVPTSDFASFTSVEPATKHVAKKFAEGVPVVVKADGAALGKGVTVCSSADEAVKAIQASLSDRRFGEAGATIVIEDRLSGFEFSLLTIVSDAVCWSLPVAQDYKRAFDGDKGPNTGGMGAFAPPVHVSSDLVAEAEAKLVKPMLATLKSREMNYRGVLFTGVMVVEGRPCCLEYNVRFGDPETETVLPLLGSGFAELLLDAARGRPLTPIHVSNDSSVTVVVASDGYPDAPRKGQTISIGRSLPGVKFFHAGTAKLDGRLAVSGGRVVAVNAVAKSLEEARAQAYSGVKQISFDGAYCRTDIAAPLR